MGASDLPGGCGCQSEQTSRCGGTLPDNPDCALHYHFGMLLGVDDFRTEQGFHIGRLRRHQRALHGWGVVYGYGVQFDADHAELRVAPGLALDAHGRDLELDEASCLSLPAWWHKHQDDDEFSAVPDKENVQFDADIVLCHGTCLSRPVPALADSCAGDSADIAYSRICEVPELKLVVRPAGSPPAPQPELDDYHLLRLLFGLDAARQDEGGEILADDQWLLDELAAAQARPAPQQTAALLSLWQAALARAAAAGRGPVDAGRFVDDELQDDCLLLAELSGIRIFLDHSDPQHAVWRATVASIRIDGRQTLLPTRILQDLLPATLLPLPAPAAVEAGPRAVSATLNAGIVTIVFDQPLAAASVTADVLRVSDFDPGSGWQLLGSEAPQYDNDVTVTLELQQDPAGSLQRLTVIGRGAAPLLGANLLPAGAASPVSDGNDLSITISGA